ncbi:hypothetical protein GGR26_003280 [Lewinella marina]|uniref:YCII-related domain-containing protein n=1 Tax=Neolewinella marina TaxID=438751 RepID=A0A2G0CDY8_9BACT|nr:YciI-like protein [Neolewinella marina]NJB87500.1 hypothetical protein [Neolewinella marina]PHK98194.1 hypothetical protein CGL56_10835 [Neolewinella marina]
MNYYILFYETVPEYTEKREPYRDIHLRLAREAQERGELILGGAFDPADGAALVFRGESPADAEAFAEADPYVRKGLVSRWYVKKWAVVIE